MKILVQAVLFLLLLTMQVTTANAAHGVSIDGELKYPATFSRFAYTSQQAKKGGELKLHAIGSFDKLNPFTLKGIEPVGLQNFVFDRLAEPSLDEPFSEYGVIAEDIEIATDGMSVVYTLNPRARYSNGDKVKIEDILYSINYLKSSDVHPFYPSYYNDISHAEVLDDQRIRFHFAQPNRELAMIASQLPVFSKNTFSQDGSAEQQDRNQFPVASGPYVIHKIIQGKSITYKRNPDYWAKDHPVKKGQFNYDLITVKYYKDPVVALEAFKAGEFDVLHVSIAKQWARDLGGAKFTSGELARQVFPHTNNAGMQGFIMNTRRDVFSDIHLRKAIGMAFDFEWTNKSLFYGQYTRSNSFFSNSHLAATGLPDGMELALLEPYREQLPAEVFTTVLQPPVAENQRELRRNLGEAKRLLLSAGYTIREGALVNPAGQPCEFEVLLVNRTFERVFSPFVKNLEKLGIKATFRTIDPTLYTERVNRFDFDMIVGTYPQSQSPGNEQRNFWHSDSADQPGSYNYAGVRSEVVDALVEKIIYAQDGESLEAACKALDRVLWYGYYLVPNWYMAGHRIAYRSIFGQPQQLPQYYNPTQLIMTWWIEDNRVR